MNLGITHSENIFKIFHMCCNVRTGIAQSVWWPDNGLDDSGFVSRQVENIFSLLQYSSRKKDKTIPYRPGEALRVPGG